MQDDIRQVIDTEYQNKLDIEGFSNMMKDPSYCYKFYWLEAIVNLISEDVWHTTFDEIIDEMIANAWYSVMEFHIHLSGVVMGDVRDGLERAIYKLAELSDLKINSSKMEIKDALKIHSKEMKSIKKQLTNMVPYRALAGFFVRSERKVNWDSTARLVEYIQEFDKSQAKLPYVLGTSTGLTREVIFNLDWMRMIQDNTVAILGWIQYEKVKWLQSNNPEVPGLVYKLAPLNEKMRKLGNVHKLWDAIMTERDLRDIFCDNQYHKQRDAGHTKTIMKMLIYIRQHDDFRLRELEEINNMPRHTKKQKDKYNTAKRKEEYYKVSRVLRILDGFEKANKDYIRLSITE